MFNKILVLFAAAIAMVGCANTNAPVELRKPGSTTLTIPVFSDQWMTWNVQLATKNKNGCAEFPQNILPAIFDKDFTLDIEGGRDIFFHVTREDERFKCDELGLFYAAQGNDYTLNLEIKNQQCIISMSEKTPNSTQNKIKIYPAYASVVDGIKVCTSKDRLY